MVAEESGAAHLGFGGAIRLLTNVVIMMKGRGCEIAKGVQTQ
jgi:hypothetical protein